MDVLHTPLWRLEIMAVIMKIRYICRKRQARLKTLLAVLTYVASLVAIGRKGRALASFFWYARLLDRTTDGEQAPLTLTLSQYLSHRERLLESIATRHIANDLLDEDWLLVHVIVYQRTLGKDSIPSLVEMGNAFLTDAARYCDGKTFPTIDQVRSIRTAIRLFLVLALELVGSKANDARAFAGSFEPLLFEADNLADFLHDVQAELINEPREDLENAGVATEKLMYCRSWHELNAVPGFSAWYERRVSACRSTWEYANPLLTCQLQSCVKSRILRKPFEKLVAKVDRWLNECSQRVNEIKSTAPQ